MPKYRFFCDLCNKDYVFNVTINEYDEKNGEFFCDKHGTKMARQYGEFALKIAKSSEEIVDKINREKNKILEKAKSGDMSTILDIYGE